MFKEKQSRVKAVAGALVLTGVFAGMYLGVNNLAFVSATEGEETTPYETVDVYEEGGTLEVERLTELAMELDDEAALQEAIRNEVLAIWGWDATEEEINQQVEFRMLTTPRAHHLSENDAKAIGAQWIYEEFGVRANANASDHNFFVSFNHEDLGIVNQSFWMGTLEMRDFHGYTENGEMIVYGNSLNAFTFVIDGITGERIAIRDGMLPLEPASTIITVGDMEVTVLDYSVEPNTCNPSFHVEQQSYHLSVEEAALLMVETIYEDFGINLDGHRIHMTLDLRLMMDETEVESWSAHVTRPDETYTAGAQLMFWVSVNAITGEIINVVDARDAYGQGVNQRVVNEEINLNGMSFTAIVTYNGNLQSNHLSLEEIVKISADAVYEEFGVSPDGLFAYMTFWGEHWTVAFRTAENGEPAFSLFLDAETGELICWGNPDGAITDQRDEANRQ